jgi:hypothetical protein
VTTVRPLDLSRTAIFGADGVARCVIGPTVFGESWKIRRMIVNTSSDLDTDVRVYLNAENPTRMIDGSFTGNRDFSETNLTLQTLDQLIVVWISGTPGTYATFLVQGTTER